MARVLFSVDEANRPPFCVSERPKHPLTKDIEDSLVALAKRINAHPFDSCANLKVYIKGTKNLVAIRENNKWVTELGRLEID